MFMWSKSVIRRSANVNEQLLSSDWDKLAALRSSGIQSNIDCAVRNIDTFSYVAQCPQLKIKLQNSTVSVCRKSHCFDFLVYI